MAGNDTIKSPLLEETAVIDKLLTPVFSIVKLLVTVPVFTSVLPKSVFLSTLIVVLPEVIFTVFPFTFISLSVAVPETLKV